MVSKSAVIGIDIGASESCVAYVGKGIVDIVQNEVSKRTTASLVGFTSRERLLGDAALAQIKSNLKNTCRNFKHVLGHGLDAKTLEEEHFWSTSTLAAGPGDQTGYAVNYKGEDRVFSAQQVTAMYLTQLRTITEKWCVSKVADCVIGVPSYYSDVHRQALLDAAKIANLPVLRLMNEHTATALAYGIYRSNEFDAEKPCTVAFCSMGHSMFSVAVVQFVKGKLTVLCEYSDKVGGRDMDRCLMQVFSEQFAKKVGSDPMNNKKAKLKLEDAVTKTKKILSANSEAGINVECLMEDEDLHSNINRADFEEMCKPMMGRVQAVLDKAISNCGIALDAIDFVEVIGGSSRVPWLKTMCSAAFNKELSTTMNAEEAVARGCALQAAMLSPLYKVRDFKVEDVSPYAIQVGWQVSTTDTEANAEADVAVTTEGEFKTAVVFPTNSPMGTVKALTFVRSKPFDIKAEYADTTQLLPGTVKDLGTYRIELPACKEPKKVKVKAKLTLHGTFVIEDACLEEEETYEETVKEKREVPAEAKEGEAAAEAPAEGNGAAAEGEASPKTEGKEEKKDEKKVEWVEVKKTKKRTKRTELKIVKSGAPGLVDSMVQTHMDEESAIQAEMAEIIETDERRNDLESYIFNMRDKCSSSGDLGAYVSDADREKFMSELQKMEDWLYDTYDATKVQYIDKLNELKAIGDPINWRQNEDKNRPEWIKAVEGTIMNYSKAAQEPGEKFSHIAPEKLAKITEKCKDAEKWLTDLTAQQAKLAKTDKPVLLCADMEKKNQELATFGDQILAEPKPAPPPEEKKEEKKEEKDEKPADAPEGNADPSNAD
eukprot:TRINITY_DN4351_c0_g2_i2.p1 TRINITY_DN4351_c0_g2~~TRINITY_DN4351_c0_g2_i2.p1  ORF type:complete len:827 (-),score=312.37 TRINITY_DN4351_c0_g2_i2:517-2997(-)